MFSVRDLGSDRETRTTSLSWGENTLTGARPATAMSRIYLLAERANKCLASE